jgi:uncharacterized protein YdhG (YjbR/CyaY superfamily)
VSRLPVGLPEKSALAGRLVPDRVEAMATEFDTIDDYISAFPENVQVILEKVRQTILRAVPGAQEAIKYQMPTITLRGRSLVHFAGWRHHIGLYPIPAGDPKFEQDIAPYRDKATARFALDKPVPYELIERLVAFSVQRQAEIP